MSGRTNLFETIASVFVPIHRDGHKFVAIAAIVTLVFFLVTASLGWLGALITVFIAYFFRDPERVTPLREGLVVSAADGMVSGLDTVVSPSEISEDLGPEPRVRVSVFLSILDVHINRAPVAGRILRSIYVPGVFMNAALDKASEENERRAIVIETASGVRIGVAAIAGLVARRIVTFVEEGDTIGIGGRFGLIRFGSRVDIYLPPGHASLVAVGQRVIGGETVIADLVSEEGPREARAT